MIELLTDLYYTTKIEVLHLIFDIKYRYKHILTNPLTNLMNIDKKELCERDLWKNNIRGRY